MAPGEDAGLRARPRSVGHLNIKNMVGPLQFGLWVLRSCLGFIPGLFGSEDERHLEQNERTQILIPAKKN